MARIKNKVTKSKKSGASFLNERTRLKNTQQTNQPYIPNGTNVETLSIDKKYNDENTINFDNLSKYSTPQAYFDQYQNDRNSITEQLASPSTLPDLTFSFNGNNDFLNNQTAIIEKYLKKGNIVTSNFTPFNGDKDKNYSQNVLNNNIEDFINGRNTYGFLNTNLYEETSIEIELDVPADALLEYTARMQTEDIPNDNDEILRNIYSTSTYQSSPYTFRKTLSSQNRKNSPFLIYNFDKKCFESRGYYKRIFNNATQNYEYEGQSGDLLKDIAIIPNLNFVHIAANDIKIVNNSNILGFVDNFNQNVINHHLALTNTPINHLYSQSVAENNYFSLPSLQFGFPHFPTFHTFNDNLLPMNKFLNKNLIIDRVSIDLKVKLQAEVFTNQELEDIDISDGLNFSLNYFILNKPNNKKDEGHSFLLLKPQTYGEKLMIQGRSQPFDDLSYTFITSHFNTLTKDKFSDATQEILNISKQNLKIHRKLWGKSWDNSQQTLAVTDMTDRLDEINFNKNIVTFGNILFHASNKNFISDIVDKKPLYTTDKITRFIQMKNNNDLVIDTVADNILKSENIENISDLSNSNIFLDFEDSIKVNSYVKKSSNYSGFLNSNNLNYQVEFKSNLNSTLQYTLFDVDYNDPNNSADIFSNKGLLQEKTYNHTRNMLNNKFDGKDLLNAQSQLSHNQTKKIFSRKTNKTLYKNLKKIDGTLFNTSEINNYYKYYLSDDQTNLHFNRVSNFSPYVLTPYDNLAFCFSISPTISPKLFKHSCQIKSGKVKFTLHGYQKRNNQIFIDEKSLREVTLNTNIIDDKSIVVDDYSNVGYLSEYIDTFNDRIFQGTFNDVDNPRKLNTLNSSKIKSGKSYIPYTKLERDVNKKWIYDNDEVFTKILKLLLAENNQNPNINKYLTSYRGTIDTNNPPPLTTNFDKADIEYFDFNIAAAITPFKLDFKDLSGANLSTAIAQIQVEFADIIEELINSFPVLGALLAASFILEQLSTGDFINLNKRYNFPCYYNNRKYGQFIDMIQQRLFTTEMSRDVNNIPVIEYVLEQKFINNVTGIELTDLNNALIPLNKSKNLQLIDSRIAEWSVEDFFNLKHVAYNDSLTEVFI